MAKWLIGSGCHLGGEWSQSRDRCIRWVHVPEEEGAVSRVSLSPKMYLTRVKISEYFGMDNISLETTVRWILEEIVRFEVDAEVCKNFTVITGNNLTKQHRQASTYYNARLTSSW